MKRTSSTSLMSTDQMSSNLIPSSHSNPTELVAYLEAIEGTDPTVRTKALMDCDSAPTVNTPLNYVQMQQFDASLNTSLVQYQMPMMFSSAELKAKRHYSSYLKSMAHHCSKQQLAPEWSDSAKGVDTQLFDALGPYSSTEGGKFCEDMLDDMVAECDTLQKVHDRQMHSSTPLSFEVTRSTNARSNSSAGYYSSSSTHSDQSQIVSAPNSVLSSQFGSSTSSPYAQQPSSISSISMTPPSIKSQQPSLQQRPNLSSTPQMANSFANSAKCAANSDSITSSPVTSPLSSTHHIPRCHSNSSSSAASNSAAPTPYSSHSGPMTPVGFYQNPGSNNSATTTINLTTTNNTPSPAVYIMPDEMTHSPYSHNNSGGGLSGNCDSGQLGFTVHQQYPHSPHFQVNLSSPVESDRSNIPSLMSSNLYEDQSSRSLPLTVSPVSKEPMTTYSMTHYHQPQYLSQPERMINTVSDLELGHILFDVVNEDGFCKTTSRQQHPLVGPTSADRLDSLAHLNNMVQQPYSCGDKQPDAPSNKYSCTNNRNHIGPSYNLQSVPFNELCAPINGSMNSESVYSGSVSSLSSHQVPMCSNYGGPNINLPNLNSTFFNENRTKLCSPNNHRSFVNYSADTDLSSSKSDSSFPTNCFKSNSVEGFSFDPKTGMMKVKKKRGRPRKNNITNGTPSSLKRDNTQSFLPSSLYSLSKEANSNHLDHQSVVNSQCTANVDPYAFPSFMEGSSMTSAPIPTLLNNTATMHSSSLSSSMNPLVKRPRGRPRVRDRSLNTSKCKPHLNSILTGVQTLVKRGRGRPKSLKTLIKEAEAANRLMSPTHANSNFINMPYGHLSFASTNFLSDRDVQQSSEAGMFIENTPFIHSESTTNIAYANLTPLSSVSPNVCTIKETSKPFVNSINNSINQTLSCCLSSPESSVQTLYPEIIETLNSISDSDLEETMPVKNAQSNPFKIELPTTENENFDIIDISVSRPPEKPQEEYSRNPLIQSVPTKNPKFEKMESFSDTSNDSLYSPLTSFDSSDEYDEDVVDGLSSSSTPSPSSSLCGSKRKLCVSTTSSQRKVAHFGVATQRSSHLERPRKPRYALSGKPKFSESLILATKKSFKQSYSDEDDNDGQYDDGCCKVPFANKATAKIDLNCFDERLPKLPKLVLKRMNASSSSVYSIKREYTNCFDQRTSNEIVQHNDYIEYSKTKKPLEMHQSMTSRKPPPSCSSNTFISPSTHLNGLIHSNHVHQAVNEIDQVCQSLVDIVCQQSDPRDPVQSCFASIDSLVMKSTLKQEAESLLLDSSSNEQQLFRTPPPPSCNYNLPLEYGSTNTTMAPLSVILKDTKTISELEQCSAIDSIILTAGQSTCIENTDSFQVGSNLKFGPFHNQDDIFTIGNFDDKHTDEDLFLDQIIAKNTNLDEELRSLELSLQQSNIILEQNISDDLTLLDNILSNQKEIHKQLDSTLMLKKDNFLQNPQKALSACEEDLEQSATTVTCSKTEENHVNLLMSVPKLLNQIADLDSVISQSNIRLISAKDERSKPIEVASLNAKSSIDDCKSKAKSYVKEHSQLSNGTIQRINDYNQMSSYSTTQNATILQEENVCSNQQTFTPTFQFSEKRLLKTQPHLNTKQLSDDCASIQVSRVDKLSNFSNVLGSSFEGNLKSKSKCIPNRIDPSNRTKNFDKKKVNLNHLVHAEYTNDVFTSKKIPDKLDVKYNGKGKLVVDPLLDNVQDFLIKRECVKLLNELLDYLEQDSKTATSDYGAICELVDDIIDSVHFSHNLKNKNFLVDCSSNLSHSEEYLNDFISKLLDQVCIKESVQPVLLSSLNQNSVSVNAHPCLPTRSDCNSFTSECSQLLPIGTSLAQREHQSCDCIFDAYSCSSSKQQHFSKDFHRIEIQNQNHLEQCSLKCPNGCESNFESNSIQQMHSTCKSVSLPKVTLQRDSMDKQKHFESNVQHSDITSSVEDEQILSNNCCFVRPSCHCVVHVDTCKLNCSIHPCSCYNACSCTNNEISCKEYEDSLHKNGSFKVAQCHPSTTLSININTQIVLENVRNPTTIIHINNGSKDGPSTSSVHSQNASQTSEEK